MKNTKFFISLLFVFIIFNIFSKKVFSSSSHNLNADTSFYTIRSGSPSDLNNWNTMRDGSGRTPTAFKTANHFIIQNGHTMSTEAVWYFGITNSYLEIENGGVLIGNHYITMNGGSFFKIYNGGTYKHNNTDRPKDYILKGTKIFEDSSNFEINNCHTEGPENITFGNLKINYTTKPPGIVNSNGGINTIRGNFIINNTSTSEYRLSSGIAYNLTIYGDLIVNNGTLTLGKSGQSNSFNIILYGNLIHTGGFIQSSLANYPINVKFSGDECHFNSVEDSLDYKNINWEVSPGSNLFLESDFKVDSARTLALNGRIYTKENTFKLDGKLTNNTYDDTKMIILDDGTNTGIFKKRFNSGEKFVFPVGDTKGNVDYVPVEFELLSAMPDGKAYINIEMQNSKYSYNNSLTNFINRHWTISSENITNPKYNLILKYSENDVNGNENEIYASYYDGFNWTLSKKCDAINHKINLDTLTAFTTISGCDEGVLPVTLNEFVFKIYSRNVDLYWTTENETGNEGYEVQRKKEGEQWLTLGFVKSNDNKKYKYTDYNITTGIYKYRLKQIDYNGNYEYYELKDYINISIPKKFFVSQNFPNPFNPVTNIIVDLPDNANTSLVIYDINGRIVKVIHNNLQMNAGSHNIPIITPDLSSGIYFYLFTANEKSISHKMIILK